MNDKLMKKFEELAKAKQAVLTCLNDEGALVDQHGLTYWAGVVERLRQDIKKELNKIL